MGTRETGANPSVEMIHEVTHEVDEVDDKGTHEVDEVDPDGPPEYGVYLLAILRGEEHVAYQHARHYLGWSTHIRDRVAAHRRGTGARFTQVLSERGYGLRVVRWWPGDRGLERQLKLAHHAARLCPLCRAGQGPVDQSPCDARMPTGPQRPTRGDACGRPTTANRSGGCAQEPLWLPPALPLVAGVHEQHARHEMRHPAPPAAERHAEIAFYGDTLMETTS